MDEIVEAISKDDVHTLKEVLIQQFTRNIKDEEEKWITDDLNADLFLHAAYVGSIECLQCLSKYGA